ncbi:hypothetical protein [Halorubrum sp. 2020YC2]|uniref:DUF7344 domain-containing protein n=1 Tax=Halorubrum sp. 2020YC2 TaxID=2836432 RepID=UPI001BE6396F|nr:hypothetical protein [Halorubrum sp. 2020YC2]QWC19013.1 hypothetical protein KI388_12975 [Halorubrum sp. 2020YC2]
MTPEISSLLGDSVPTYEKKRDVDRTELSEETVFTLLSARRRREMLRILTQSGGEATVADMVAEVAHREHGRDVNAAKRKAIYVSLHQIHIPKFVEAGVLEHDVANRTIRPIGLWKQLYAYLEFDPLETKQGLLSRMFRPKTGRATD